MEPSWTPEELAQILEQHGSALQLYAAQWSHSAEDCVQEALLQLIRQKTRPHNVVAWLYRVIRNRGISQRRSWLRRRRHETAAGSRAALWFEPQTAGDLDSRLAAQTLSQLPTKQREIIVARIWGGLSFEDIAEIVGTSRSGAHRKYQEALQALRDKLGIEVAS